MTYIKKNLSDKVLILADEYRNNAPGGISSVIRYYRPFFETFKYIPSYKSGKILDKLKYVGGAYLKLFWKLLSDKDIQIVHLHSAADGSFKMNSRFLRMSKFFGKKVVFHIHASRFKDFWNEKDENHRKYIIRILNAADKVLVLSNSWKAWFADAGVCSCKIRVLNNITPHPCGDKIRNDKVMNVLFLGLIGERKGIFDVLEALHRHKSDLEDKIHLYIGGNGDTKKLEKMIAEYSLNGFVEFCGFVHGEKKNELLRKADVFLLPSKNEGLPISILEAMSYGCAIISTPVGGIPEIVTDNGILVKPSDVNGIAESLKILAESEDMVSEMGQKSLLTVKDFYPEKVISDLNDIYAGLTLSGERN